MTGLEFSLGSRQGDGGDGLGVLTGLSVYERSTGGDDTDGPIAGDACYGHILQLERPVRPAPTEERSVAG